MTPFTEYVSNRIFNNSLIIVYNIVSLCGTTRVTRVKSDETSFTGEHFSTIG